MESSFRLVWVFYRIRIFDILTDYTKSMVLRSDLTLVGDNIFSCVATPNGRQSCSRYAENCTAITQSQVETYFTTEVLPLFNLDPLKEIANQKYIAFLGASGETTEIYNVLEGGKIMASYRACYPRKISFENTLWKFCNYY